MKQLAMRLIPFLAFAVAGCVGFDDTEDTLSSESGLESTDVEDHGSPAPTNASPEAASPLFDQCSPLSAAPCSGVSVGEFCGQGPRWCLPAQTLPDGSTWCACQSHSTI